MNLCPVPRMCALIGALLLSCHTTASAANDVQIEWRFDKDGDYRGWKIGGQIADAAVSGGALSGRATGNDPIIFGPVFEIPASPTACVEICMTATERSGCELFWTQTLEGKFGGFSQQKCRTFTSVGDGQEHVYRVYPFWQSVNKIIRLRFDPPSAGKFAIKWIRIVDSDAGKTSNETSWPADAIARDWKPMGDVAEATSGPILATPKLSIKADEYAFVCVRLASRSGGTARLYAASQAIIGWESTSFPLRGDGKMHSYNIDMGSLKTWHGQVVLLGLQLPSSTDGKIDSIQVCQEPQGSVELEPAYFGPTDGINRAGRPAGVTLNLRNYGGAVAQNVSATLIPPAGVEVIGSPRQTLDRLSLYQPRTLDWQIKSANTGKVDLTVKIESPGVEPITSNTTLELTTAPAVPKTDYIPEPKPVKSKYEIGTFYFPGWSTPARWQPIRDYPNRKPILGWYDEANPECADWQIKWAVEHGITFFMVDWYWSQGNRHLDHWIHNAFPKARFRKYLKWCVMWANHNPPNTHSEDDWRKVTQYWIDNYFQMPEYYRIDDKPVVFIWTPINVRHDLGGVENSAKLYAISQEMAKKAGYKGIYFAAVNNHESPKLAEQLKTEGFEALTSYHGFNISRQKAGSDRFTFDRVVETALDTWKKEDAESQGLKYFPIVDTGWDARPWHQEKTVVISGRTPQLLGKMCRLARQYADQTNKRIIALGPWNEWGEGSYIEPYAEYGFADLDEIRAAFCEPGDYPPNLIPTDVGRGGYDLPPYVPKTAWEFNTDGDLEGWSSSQVADLKVQGGLLTGRSTGNDPLLHITGLRVEAANLSKVSFRFKSDTKGLVQIYWATSLIQMSGQTNINLEVPGDNQFHDYEIDLSHNKLWRGLITQFRLDPAIAPNVKFELDYIRLHGK